MYHWNIRKKRKWSGKKEIMDEIFPNYTSKKVMNSKQNKLVGSIPGLSCSETLKDKDQEKILRAARKKIIKKNIQKSSQ